MKKILWLCSVLILLVSAIAMNEFLIKNKESPTTQKNQPTNIIADFQEGKHYTEVNYNEIKGILVAMGIRKDQTFEIFSYTCPACLALESVMSEFETKLNIDIAKIQVGYENIPLAETDYIINKLLSGDELKLAKLKLFSIMQDTSRTSTQKISDLNDFLPSIGINKQQVEEMSTLPEKYRINSTELADLLKLESTPSLFIKSKYLINMKEVGNMENLINLSAFLIKKD